jgi:nucleotide sugar dehydrogenase
MGLPLACVFADRGFTVVGIDIDEQRVDSINKGINPLPEEPGLGELLTAVIEKNTLTASIDPASARMHIIIIPILLTDHGADFSILRDVSRKIATQLRKGDIVVLESTAPPGTCDTVLSPLLEESGLQPGKDFGMAHCPERTMSGTALKDITENYPKIVGASDAKTAHMLEKVYSRINSRGVLLMKDMKTAEAVKVFEGVYRDVNIALANELALYCEQRGIDVCAVIEAANSQPYSHIHDPGVGVGGHCIPVYPHFIMGEKTPLIKTARTINEGMPLYTVTVAETLLQKNGMSLSRARVLLLGISFRAGVKEERLSPFFAVRDHLLKKGATISAYDPLYSPQEVESFDVTYKKDFKNVDCIMILTEASEFKDLDWNSIYNEGVRVIVDGRNILSRTQMESIGFVYAGIGT